MSMSARWTIAALFSLLFMSPDASKGATFTCVGRVDTSLSGDTFLNSLEGFVRPKDSLCAQVMLTGEIVSGDAQKLEELVQANLPFLSMLSLNSIGGNVSAAIQAGRIARRYYLATEAPWKFGPQKPTMYIANGGSKITPGATCASACFFVWLGGVDRSGNLLAIHRPFPSDRDMQRLSPADASHLYHELSDAVSVYLADVEAQPHWLLDMMKIPSNDLYILPKDQIYEELSGKPPSFAQWEYSKCGSLTIQQTNDQKALSEQRLRGTLPQSMASYLDHIDRLSTDIVHCEVRAVIGARWLLHGRRESSTD